MNNQNLINKLNESNINYLIMRGLHSNDLDKDIDILLEEFEVVPPFIKHKRILHFQYEERHKGITFVSQDALKRKVWNGEYWELSLKDKIRMKILRFIKKAYCLIV